MREYEVDFFIKENGDCPVKEFLLSIDKKMRAKILVDIDLLEENGPQLREPYSKHLEDGILKFVLSRGRISHGCYISSLLGRKSSSQMDLLRKLRKRRNLKLRPRKNIVQNT